MMEAVNVFPRTYERAPKYEKYRSGVNLGWIDEKYARTKQNCLYSVCHGIKITMDNLLQAISSSEKTVLNIRLLVHSEDLSS